VEIGWVEAPQRLLVVPLKRYCSTCRQSQIHGAKLNRGESSMSKSIHLGLPSACNFRLAVRRGRRIRLRNALQCTMRKRQDAKSARRIGADCERHEGAPKKSARRHIVPRPKGGMRTLREGAYGFTCMPDNPEHRPLTRLLG